MIIRQPRPHESVLFLCLVVHANCDMSHVMNPYIPPGNYPHSQVGIFLNISEGSCGSLGASLTSSIMYVRIPVSMQVCGQNV